MIPFLTYAVVAGAAAALGFYARYWWGYTTGYLKGYSDGSANRPIRPTCFSRTKGGRPATPAEAAR